jgi:hypothetical protein
VIEGELLGTSSVLMSLSSSCCAGLKSMRCICSSRGGSDADAAASCWASIADAPLNAVMGTCTSAAASAAPGADCVMESTRTGAEWSGAKGLDGAGVDWITTVGSSIAILGGGYGGGRGTNWGFGARFEDDGMT